MPPCPAVHDVPHGVGRDSVLVGYLPGGVTVTEFLSNIPNVRFGKFRPHIRFPDTVIGGF